MLDIGYNGSNIITSKLTAGIATFVQGLAERCGNQMVAFRESQENIQVGMNN